MDNFTLEHLNSIFSKKNDSLEITEYYTMIGLEDFIDEDKKARAKEDNPNIYAKKINKGNTIKYSIRLDNNGKFYNPISIYDSNNTQYTFLDRTCRSNDKFRQVGYKTFNLYISFLNTKNIAWLHHAERENE